MTTLLALLPGLAALVATMALLWVVSIFLRNVSIIDLFWGPGIAIATTAYFLTMPDVGARAVLMLVLVWAWALRLGIYLTMRNMGKPEDRRYAAMRERNDPGFWYKSLYLVFLLQAVLGWVVSFPAYGAMTAATAPGWLDFVGTAIFLFGLVWESLADYQLAAFLRDRKSSGEVMDRGVWRYSRHPNYFGEFCLWWGLWLIAVAAGAWWTIIGPLLLSFFLLRVSGVAMLEKDIGERRPAYKAYIERTNAFVPGPPRRQDS